MSRYRAFTFGLFAVIAVLVAAFQSPGQMSVDSIISVYEASLGHATGWGPTFMSAAIAWLGGGTVGTSLLVAITCLLTYGSLAILLADASVRELPVWQVVGAFVISLNPLFMFYVGILWKDVMLATTAILAAALLLSAGAEPVCGGTCRSRFPSCCVAHWC